MDPSVVPAVGGGIEHTFRGPRRGLYVQSEARNESWASAQALTSHCAPSAVAGARNGKNEDGSFSVVFRRWREAKRDLDDWPIGLPPRTA